MAAIQECGFELIQHLPYSPDLASSDYKLFHKMKRNLICRHFDGDDDVIYAVDHLLTVHNVEVEVCVLYDWWTKLENVEGMMLKNKCARFSLTDSFYLRP